MSISCAAGQLRPLKDNRVLMAVETPSRIENFLEGDDEEMEDLGEPPLADKLDTLLNGDRIHLTESEDPDE